MNIFLKILFRMTEIVVILYVERSLYKMNRMTQIVQQAKTRKETMLICFDTKLSRYMIIPIKKQANIPEEFISLCIVRGGRVIPIVIE